MNEPRLDATGLPRCFLEAGVCITVLDVILSTVATWRWGAR